MRNDFIKIIILTIVIFFIASLTSFLYFNFTIEKGYKIGFPFVYYNEFQLRGNDFKNFNFTISGFIYNGLICFLIAFILRSLGKKLTPAD